MLFSALKEKSVSVPPLDLKREYKELAADIRGRLEQLFVSGSFILGKEVEEFERRFAEYHGTRFAVGVGSGSDALLLSLMAHGIRGGDEVITSAWTFVATVSGILRLGAKPVFVDIDPDTFNINPALIRKAVTPKTRAIIPVHLYGHPCAMPEIIDVARQHRLAVIEDCAQAHGAELEGGRVGTFGEVGCFSFYPTKNLGAYGDAGAVVTDNETFAAHIRQMRVHGSSQGQIYDSVFGINSRLDEVQAAVLNAKLGHLPAWNESRRKAAAYYTKKLTEIGLRDIALPVVRPGVRHVFHLYTVRAKHRDRLADRLKQRGISVIVHYPVPIHRQPAFEKLATSRYELPETERAADEVLSLPIFPQITRREQDQVVEALRDSAT